jgi:hypothetical protein
MNIVDIPVSPLSRKFLIHQFKFPCAGQKTTNLLIPLSAKDLLYQQLTYRFPNAKTTQLRKTLTSTISFLLPDTLTRHSSPHVWKIGMHLDKLHKEAMCQAAAEAEARGEEVFAALRQWLSMRHIEDDEYSLEPAAIKCYARWRKKHLESGQKKMSNSHRFDVRFVQSNGENLAKLPPLSDDELTALECYFLAQHPYTFQDSRGRPLKKLKSQLKYFIWRKIGRRKPYQVAKRFKVSEYVIRYSVRQFMLFIKHNEKLPSPTHYICDLFG